MGIARDPELPGYEEFEKQTWGFKVRIHELGFEDQSLRLDQHDRLSVERRLSNAAEGQGNSPLSDIKTSDIARLMELFQVRRTRNDSSNHS